MAIAVHELDMTGRPTAGATRHALFVVRPLPYDPAASRRRGAGGEAASAGSRSAAPPACRPHVAPVARSRSHTRRSGPPARVRRRLAGAVVAVALVAVGGLAGAAGGADAAGPAPAPPAVVVVAPGDTVWALAQAYVPEGQSLQAYVAETLELNGLDGAVLRPGTTLRMPVR